MLALGAVACDCGTAEVAPGAKKDAGTAVGDANTGDAFFSDRTAVPDRGGSDTFGQDTLLTDSFVPGQLGDGCSSADDCSGGLLCDHNLCVQCIVEGDCSNSQVCQAGHCIDACADGTLCGGGGACCPTGFDCVADQCLAGCAGTRCGAAGLCCGVGTVCEQDRCALDCGANARCGDAMDICCGAGQVCYGSVCVTPSNPCQRHVDCPGDQLCAVETGLCFDRTFLHSCMYHPPIGLFNPQVEWGWSGGTVEPEYNQIMSAPAVANLNDDNGDNVIDEKDIPDIVFMTFHQGGAYMRRGVLRAVSGDGSGPVLDISQPEIHGSSCPAVADLDGDGIPEIVVDKLLDMVVTDRTRYYVTATYAFHVDGSLYWVADGTGSSNGGAAIADLNNDGSPEVITRDRVLNHDGTVLCSFTYKTLLPIAADLDLDGDLEVVVGGAAYHAVDDGSGNCTVAYDTGPGGASAVANFDSDPNPEIVFPSGGVLYLYDHDGTEIWSEPIPVNMARVLDIYGVSDCNGSSSKGCNPGGGAPTIADFDGDGQPEIGLAARWYYLVYETDGTVTWGHNTKDFSSAVTGSSVFDFEGDGSAEVVYADEAYLRVYSGVGGSTDADGDGLLDPEILLELPNASGTLYEYPLVADVDGDYRAEILVVENNYVFSGGSGFRVFGDAQDNWVGTRRIWNQHSYHVTNVCDGVDRACLAADNHYGAIPQNELNNWDLNWLNNYRQNTQGEGLFWAPDFVVVNLDVVCLPDLSLAVSFDLLNRGTRAAAANVPVTIYTDSSSVTVLSTQTLLPGTAETFHYTIPAATSTHCAQPTQVRVVGDDDGQGGHTLNECENGGEDNNSATAAVSCQTPDLIISDVVAACQEDLSLYVTFALGNQGDGLALAGVPVSIAVDGVVQGTAESTMDLGPGGVEYLSWWLTTPIVGCDFPQSVVITADNRDGQGEVQECAAGAEDNNSATLSQITCQTADLVVANLQAVCDSSNLQLEITFDVVNQGHQPAPSGVPVQLSVDGQPLHQVTTSQELAPGASESFSWTWTVDSSHHYVMFSLTVDVDAAATGNGIVHECGTGAEDNNQTVLADLYCSPEG